MCKLLQLFIDLVDCVHRNGFRSFTPKAGVQVKSNISVMFQATLNLYAHFTNHCLAVLRNFLGDFWERDIFLKG